MAVSDAAVKQFIDVMKTATEHTCEPETAVATIAAVRSKLGKRLVSLPLQVAKVTAAIRSLKSTVIETDISTVVSWSEEEWSKTLWKLLEASVSGTLFGQTCSEVLLSDDRWREAIVAAVQGHKKEEQHQVGVWWSCRCCTVLALLTIALASMTLAGMLPTLAKNSAGSTLWSLLIVVVALVWYSRGADHWIFVTVVEEANESIPVGWPTIESAKDQSDTVKGEAMIQLKQEMAMFKTELDPLSPTLRSSAPVCSPMAGAALVPIRDQAAKIKAIIEAIASSSSISENWPLQFWSEVATSCEPLHPALKALLEGHGYIGAQTLSAPRGVELIAELEHLEGLGAPSQGTAAGRFQGLDLPDHGTGQEDLLNTERWHSQLPTDFARAAPDIYRSIRTGGSSSVQDWISSFFAADQKSTQTFQQKFEQAAQIDFKITTCRTHAELMALLSTDDFLEINLRSLAAWLHFKRTGDIDAADSMLAVRAPGSMMDVAPSWLLTSSANHSSAEFRRKQRSGGKGGPGEKGFLGKDGKQGRACTEAKADPEKSK